MDINTIQYSFNRKLAECNLTIKYIVSNTEFKKLVHIFEQLSNNKVTVVKVCILVNEFKVGVHPLRVIGLSACVHAIGLFLNRHRGFTCVLFKM